jgi:hypothetical protein
MCTQGTLPGDIGKLAPHLEELSLEGTLLSGTLPSLPSSLEILDLEDTELSGVIPWDISKLVNLKYLDLSRTQQNYHDPLALSGTIPGEISQLTKLTHLDITGGLMKGESSAIVIRVWVRMHDHR